MNGRGRVSTTSYRNDIVDVKSHKTSARGVFDFRAPVRLYILHVIVYRNAHELPVTTVSLSPSEISKRSKVYFPRRKSLDASLCWSCQKCLPKLPSKGRISNTFYRYERKSFRFFFFSKQFMGP